MLWTKPVQKLRQLIAVLAWSTAVDGLLIDSHVPQFQIAALEAKSSQP